MHGNEDSRNTETEYFRSDISHITGLNVRRNEKVIHNPGVPYLVSTPDGLVYDRLTTIVGTVEIKYVSEKAKAHGLQLTKDQNGFEKWCVSSGHPWLTQMFVQMVTTRAEFSILAMKKEGRWVTVRVEYDEEIAQKIIRNIWSAYKVTILKLPKETLEKKCTMLKKRVGRPKKKCKSVRKHNFPKLQTLMNISIEPWTESVNSTIDTTSPLTENDHDLTS